MDPALGGLVGHATATVVISSGHGSGHPVGHLPKTVTVGTAPLQFVVGTVLAHVVVPRQKCVYVDVICWGGTHL